jgi:hypothetical protein
MSTITRKQEVLKCSAVSLCRSAVGLFSSPRSQETVAISPPVPKNDSSLLDFCEEKFGVRPLEIAKDNSSITFKFTNHEQVFVFFGIYQQLKEPKFIDCPVIDDEQNTLQIGKEDAKKFLELFLNCQNQKLAILDFCEKNLAIKPISIKLTSGNSSITFEFANHESFLSFFMNYSKIEALGLITCQSPFTQVPNQKTLQIVGKDAKKFLDFFSNSTNQTCHFELEPSQLTPTPQ